MVHRRSSFVNVVNLFSLTIPSHHPSGMSQERFREINAWLGEEVVTFSDYEVPTGVGKAESVAAP